jgi:16S rRNA A1518/A1519 N6-dimethyltransferase RsmA/KsgA/DIM1 with predicted DNA glycosylase/AP lyase activity
VPSPHKIVERMLELAEVKQTDTVYDLGSGDGRILVTAAQKFGARAVGIEIDPELAKKSEARLQELALSNRAKVIQANLLEVDLSPASVVTLYLLTSANTMLKPNLEKSLKPGSRVVSHDFQIDGWTPVKTERVRGEGRTHTIYLYEIGKQ